MANSRMYLKNTRTGNEFNLGKYYPSTGWYCKDSSDLGDSLNEFFDKQDFGHLTDEQKAANAAEPGFGVPYISAGGMDGDEWVIVIR